MRRARPNHQALCLNLAGVTNNNSPLRREGSSPSTERLHKRRLPIETTLPRQTPSPVIPDCIVTPRSQPQPVQILCVGNYDLDKTLGKGRFGKVKRATHALVKEKVAIKIISKKKLSKLDGAAELIKREIEVLKSLQHPHVVQLYEVIETDKMIFLIMEYASGGEVLDFIITHGKLAEDKARTLFRQIVAAISYCHDQLIVHRDLKAENLLLDEDLNIKVVDFGFATKFDPNKTMQASCGSPMYAAPEIVQKKEYIGPEVDIWCMGVLLYVFVCGSLPFAGKDMLTLFTNIVNVDYTIPDFLSKECAELLRSILVADTTKRATLEQIKNHPWVKADDNWECPFTIGSKKHRRENLDKTILSNMEVLGFDLQQTIDAVTNQSYNAAYASYHLFERKLNAKTVTTITDISSIPLNQLPSDWAAIEQLVSRQGSPNSLPNSANSSPANSRPNSPPRILPTHTKPKLTHTTSAKFQVATRARTCSPSHQRPKLPETLSNRPRTRLQNSMLAPPRTESEVQPSTLRVRPPMKRTKTPKELFRRRAPECKLIEIPPELQVYDLPVPFTPRERKSKPLFRCHSADFSSIDLKAREGITREDLTREKPVWTSKEHIQFNRNVSARNFGKVTPPSNLVPVTAPRLLSMEDYEKYRNPIAEIPQPKSKQEKSGKFASIVNWTKQVLAKRTEPAVSEDVPRSVRTVFSGETTTSKDPHIVLENIKNLFRRCGIEYQAQTTFCIKGTRAPENPVEFEIEVCAVPGLSKMYLLRLHRIEGEWEDYKNFCSFILQNVEL